jgi:5-methylcytosine-specific restriction endonuclease McrA
MPMVIRIIRKYCGEEYIPQSYDKYFKSKQNLKETMIKEIENKCLQDVIPRLQPKGYNNIYKHFHILNETGRKYKLPPKDKRYIVLTKKAQSFFKDNYYELSKILIYEWAKFLEKTNFTPRLISKIENLGSNNRSSLTKYKNILLKQMESKCFYCNCNISYNNIHIDHFIPWSYIYEDAIWNLIISCPECNLKKSDYLAPKQCVQKIEDRNSQYNLNEYNKDIMEYYVLILR